MSDFVLTIESDDEEQQQQTGVPSKAPAPAHKRGVPTEDGDEGDRGVGEGPKRQKVTKREKKGRKNSMDRKGKGRGQQMGEDEHEHDNEDDDDDDDQGLAMDNDFQFDGLGGGQVYSSRGATRSDAWVGVEDSVKSECRDGRIRVYTDADTTCTSSLYLYLPSHHQDLDKSADLFRRKNAIVSSHKPWMPCHPRMHARRKTQRHWG